jgi:hypothetical protein
LKITLFTAVDDTENRVRFLQKGKIMSMATKEKFDALRSGQTVRFPLLEASATFADERYQGRISLGSNFDRFLREHAVTHQIRVDEDYFIVTKR